MEDAIQPDEVITHIPLNAEVRLIITWGDSGKVDVVFEENDPGQLMAKTMLINMINQAL